MDSENQYINAVQAGNAVNQVHANQKPSIDGLIRDILTANLDTVMNNKKNELDQVLERQLSVKQYHDLLAKINKLTDKDGKVKVDAELEKMLQNAVKKGDAPEAENAHKMDDLKIVPVGKEYKTEERQRLIENIRMHTEDLNTQNDMQMNKVTHYTNQMYEIYQAMRSVPKSNEESKKAMIRNVGGR